METEFVTWGDWEIGDKVEFVGFTPEVGVLIPDYLRFTPGKVYIIVEDRFGDIGPADDDGDVPGGNWGFKFKRV